jgi:hypothetical protein
VRNITGVRYLADHFIRRRSMFEKMQSRRFHLNRHRNGLYAEERDAIWHC